MFECLHSPPPPILLLKSNSQCGGSWRWGLWELIRMRQNHVGGGPRDGLRALMRREGDIEPGLSFHTQRRNHVSTQ